MVPMEGAAGGIGAAAITTLFETVDVQPAALVTVKAYVVPAGSPLTVVDVLLPVVVIPPGLRVNVHEPDGRPFKTTEPVCTVQDGGVIVPIAGADGAVRGAAVPLPGVLVQPSTVVVTV